MTTWVLGPNDPDRYRYSNSLMTGLALLGCFTPEHPVRGIADMADALGLGRTTAHRYACTHHTLGYLEHTANRKYRLSSGAWDVGFAMLDSLPVRRAARESLRELRDQTGRTACLWMLAEGELVCIDRWHGSGQGQYQVDAGIGLGSRLPSYCTAAGKALLARLPAAERKRTIRHLRLKRHGPKTIASKRALQAELERILGADAEQSIVFEDEEVAHGQASAGGCDPGRGWAAGWRRAGQCSRAGRDTQASGAAVRARSQRCRSADHWEAEVHARGAALSQERDEIGEGALRCMNGSSRRSSEARETPSPGRPLGI